MHELPVLDHDAVLAAVTAQEAISYVRDALVKHHNGAWSMPPKVYLDSPPYGDFRAMPARGDGLAIVKWVTSFPGNGPRGLPAVMGIVCVSDATTGAPLMLLDAAAVTMLRTGAVAAVAAQTLARPKAWSVGMIGCGQNGRWVARCLAAAGYGPGYCHDTDPAAAERLAQELGWRVADTRDDALESDIVCCVTPGSEPVVDVGDLHAGVHLNLLGADAAGKAEATLKAIAACSLFCDEWEQASHGGELAGAVRAGRVTQNDVTEVGAVLAGDAAGREHPEEMTLFDSTGLAVQDLAIARAALTAWREDRVEAQRVRL